MFVLGSTATLLTGVGLEARFWKLPTGGAAAAVPAKANDKAKAADVTNQTRRTCAHLPNISRPFGESGPAADLGASGSRRAFKLSRAGLSSHRQAPHRPITAITTCQRSGCCEVARPA